MRLRWRCNYYKITTKAFDQVVKVIKNATIIGMQLYGVNYYKKKSNYSE